MNITAVVYLCQICNAHQWDDLHGTI